MKKTAKKTTKMEQGTIVILCTHFELRRHDYYHVQEELMVQAFLKNGLALHNVPGRAKCYWTITHIQSGESLLSRPKKFVKVPDAKTFLQDIAALRNWRTNASEIRKDKETLKLVADYPDDKTVNDDDD